MIDHPRAEVRIPWFSFQIVVKPWIHFFFFSHLSFSGEALCHALGLVVKWKFLKDSQVEMGFRPTLLGSENRTETNKMVSDAKETWIIHKVEP